MYVNATANVTVDSNDNLNGPAEIVGVMGNLDTHEGEGESDTTNFKSQLTLIIMF